MATCICGDSITNTGIDSCNKPLPVKKSGFLVNTYQSDGSTKNSYDSTVPLTQAVLDALVNNSDASLRWYPLPEFNVSTSETADNVTEQDPAGNVFYVKDGITKETFEMWNLPRKYAKQLESTRCADLAIFFVHIDGSVSGGTASGAILYPKRLSGSSVQVMGMDATDTTTAKVKMSFNYQISEKANDQNYISSDAITADVLGARGLIDFTAEITSTGQTAMVVKFTNASGSVNAITKQKGLLVANFVSTVGGATSKIRNTTTGADVTITSVTENDGVYTLNYTSQTVGNKLVPFFKKNRYFCITAIGTVV